MKWVDTHCHLDAAEFDPDREAVVIRAHEADVDSIIVPAVERANFGAVSSVCREYAGCNPAYGIHPLTVGRACEDDLTVLRETLRREPAVAVGEIGLDFFVEGHDEGLQRFYFSEQLKIARELNLPVLLHVRRAVDAVLVELTRVPVRGGIAHAFNGSRQQAEQFINRGCKLGFGGAMTHPRATHLRKLATELPLESLVLETDAPDIPPAWISHERNEPGEIPRIAAVLGTLRGLSLEKVCLATTQNAQEVITGLVTASKKPSVADQCPGGVTAAIR